MASDDQILSRSMQSEQGKPTYRVTGVNPKGGDIDEQFALIETEFGYGAPASDPSHRKIRVGDSLPEGEVTAITGDGIQVIPDEGPEYVIPLGGRQGYTPPVTEKKPEPPVSPRERLGDTMSERFNDPDIGITESLTQRARALREAFQDQSKFYDTDDPSEISDAAQSDFADAQENQRLLESLDTGDGRNMMFQDDEGSLSSYYVDNEGDAIRMEPDPDTSKIYGDYKYNDPSERYEGSPKSDPLKDEFTGMLYEADQKRKKQKESAAMDELNRMFESQDWTQ